MISVNVSYRARASVDPGLDRQAGHPKAPRTPRILPNFRLLPYSCSKPYAPALAKVVPGSQRTVMVRASWPCSVVPHVGSAQVNTNAEAKASPG
jgi:hypothetical protein